MPALTRGAAALLQKTSPPPDNHSPNPKETRNGNAPEKTLGLRKPVHGMAEEVWKAHHGIDVYTGQHRKDANTYQVDHQIECQLAEHALVRAIGAAGVHGASTSAMQTAESLRAALNSVTNLCCTTKSVNQSKKGPFCAAMNRLRAADERGGSLRLVTLEQLARQGRAKWLVDEGVWAKIEHEVVRSYDSFQLAVEDSSGGLQLSSKLSVATVEELGVILSRLGVM